MPDTNKENSLQLLGNLITVPDSGLPAKWMESDVQSLLELAREQGVEALLTSQIKKAGHPGLSADLASMLDSFCLQHRALEMVREKEIRRVLAALSGQQISCLLFKGSALAYNLYAEPFTRSRCDSDLLFARRADADRAWDVLAALGYRKLNTVDGDLINSQFPCIRNVSQSLTHTLDIHWELSNHRELSCFSYEDLWSEAEALEGHEGFIRTPCRVHALLIACLHRLAHAVEGEQNRLIWLYDIHLLIEKMTTAEWQQVAETAAQLNLQAALEDGIQSSRRYFSTRLSVEEESWLKDRGNSTDKSFARDSRLETDLKNIRSVPGLKRKWQLVMEYLFPSADYMRQKYKVSNDLTLPLWYLWRALKGVSVRLWNHLFGTR